MQENNSKMNCYTDKERDNLIKVSIGLATIISNSEDFTKETIEETLNLSKGFLCIPKISKMQKEVEYYYLKKYDSQLSLKF